MNKEQEEALCDLSAFIDNCIHNSDGKDDPKAFFSVLSVLFHDIEGLGRIDELFVPRTKGYCKLLNDKLVGEKENGSYNS